eukprot:TRINITY_DN15599_c0_g2_i1.p1 TRINITY_DN15599_c0_g2~~TRINITY_DN15599_c0_g2_i1.p1  ORF type:complete len:491 (-),score=112.73 TRINITY_DN15599_c0_g2_i1:69-1448(-)
MYRIGAIKYLQDESNRVDVLISLGMIIVFSIRIASSPNNDTASVYSFWEVFNAILLWFRIGFIFQVHPTIGPLLRTTFAIMNDVMNFIVLAGLFVIGFSLSLFFLLHDQGLDEFSSLSQTFLTLYIGHLGAFDYGQFTTLADEDAGFLYFYAIVLFSIYLFISSVVMLNLLIAMLSQTYSRVQEVSVAEYTFGKARLTWQLDINNNELPPPFNLVVTLIYFLHMILALLLKAISFCFPKTSAFRKKIESTPTEVEEIAAELLDDDIQRAGKFGGGNPTSRSNLPWPWTCKHCHCINSHYRPTPSVDFITSKGSVTFRDAALNPQSTQGDALSEGSFVSCDTVTCFECLRVANPLGHDAHFREKISYVVFLLIVWIPLMLCVIFPSIVYGIFDLILSLFNVREERRKREVSRKVVDLPETRYKNDRARYVRSLFESDPVTMEDISKNLHKLRQDLERIAG